MVYFAVWKMQSAMMESTSTPPPPLFILPGRPNGKLTFTSTFTADEFKNDPRNPNAGKGGH